MQRKRSWSAPWIALATFALLVLAGTLAPNVQWMQAGLTLQTNTLCQTNSSRLQDAAYDVRPPNEQRFYLATFKEVEEQAAFLAECIVTTWGVAAYQHLEYSPRRTMDPGKASLFVFPPYSAWETNWPMYKQGPGGANLGRAGSRQCVSFHEDLMNAALATHSRLAKIWSAKQPQHAQVPRLLFFDSFPYYSTNPEFGRYYESDQLAWAKLSAMQGRHRPGIDISLPPPTHNALQFYPYQSLPDSKSALSPANRTLLFFKGNFNTKPELRGELGKLHNETRGVLIINTAAEGADKYPYAELMATALFSGVPRGAEEFSYRFSEAVCSGSVPVVVSDGWVLPFSDVVDPLSYCLHVPETELPNLIERLESITPEQHKTMRANALRFCHRYIATMYLNVDSMIDVALRYHVSHVAA